MLARDPIDKMQSKRLVVKRLTLTGLGRRADGLVTTSCVHYNLNKENFHVTWGYPDVCKES